MQEPAQAISDTHARAPNDTIIIIIHVRRWAVNRFSHQARHRQMARDENAVEAISIIINAFAVSDRKSICIRIALIIAMLCKVHTWKSTSLLFRKKH